MKRYNNPRNRVLKKRPKDLKLTSKGYYGTKMLRRLILDEAHHLAYSIHPGSTKMYLNLKQKYWWTRMKVDISDYVAQCDTCRRVKA